MMSGTHQAPFSSSGMASVPRTYLKCARSTLFSAISWQQVAMVKSRTTIGDQSGSRSSGTSGTS